MLAIQAWGGSGERGSTHVMPASYRSSSGLLHSPLQRVCVWYIATARVAPSGTLPDNDLVLLFWSILIMWELWSPAACLSQ